jgi:hypothetical protein
MKILIITSICLIILCAIIGSLQTETFTDNKLVLYTEISDKYLYIITDSHNYTSKIPDIKNIEILNKSTNKFNYNLKDKSIQLILTDIYNYIIIANSIKANKPKLFTIVPDEKLMLFIKPNVINTKNTSLKNYINTNTQDTNNTIKIGYINDTDTELIKALIRSMDLSLDNIILKKITYQEKLENLDLVFIFDSINNKFLYENLNIQENTYSFYDYTKDVDINKIKYYFPVIKQKNIVISDYFNKGQNVINNISVYAFDMVLYGFADAEENYALTSQYSSLNVLCETYDKINYYTQYFDFFKQTMDYINSENLRVLNISNRNNLPILEQFQNQNVPGFYNSEKQQFYSDRDTINGVPVILNDTITLSSQSREEENGEYTVIDQEQRILQKIQVLEEAPSKKEYICYNNPLVLSENFCDEKYWDKPCEYNTECPFYQKNTTYKNYRGGCYNGACEMPIGVKRIAFRHYDENTKPWCHGCPDTEDLSPECCQNKNYAFALDETT